MLLGKLFLNGKSPSLKIQVKKADALLYLLWHLFVCLLANQLPAGLITADGQQQNVMVYTTSYQQISGVQQIQFS